jgi:hypothetical protein
MQLVRLTGVGSRYGILLAYSGGIGVFPGSPDNCWWDWRMSIADRELVVRDWSMGMRRLGMRCGQALLCRTAECDAARRCSVQLRNAMRAPD